MKQSTIADALFKLLDKLGKTDDDKSYIAYICFSTLGGLLLKMHGESKFDELVTDIKLKMDESNKAFENYSKEMN